jgi:uncharacterized protein (TIGR00251 family)
VLLNQHREGVDLSVRVKPRASKSRVLGQRGDAVEVAIAAPPVDGEANAELVRTLAQFFDIARSRVRIARGSTGKNKVVRLLGLAENDVIARLAELP